MVDEKDNKSVEADAVAPDDGAVVEASPAGDDAASVSTASDTTVAKRKVRGGRSVPVGVAHVKASFNNTQVAITDPKGAVISWGSAGRSGFKGSRKSTAFAATMVAQEAARTAAARGMHEVVVRLQGAGAGRESAVRGLQSAGLSVSAIQDVTPVPHNGCRARKRRRV